MTEEQNGRHSPLPRDRLTIDEPFLRLLFYWHGPILWNYLVHASRAKGLENPLTFAASQPYYLTLLSKL